MCKFLQKSLTTLVATCLAAISLTFLPRAATADEELRLMTWEGYLDDPIPEAFVNDTGASVNRTYMGSNDEYMAKLAAGGGDYDLVVIVTSLARRAIKSNFIEPLDLSQIPNFGQLHQRFQDLEYFKHDGETYCAPMIWGYFPLTLNAEVIPERNDFDLLFDPQYAGKISMWDDIATMAFVAYQMGYENHWDLTDEELEVVKARLIEQKPLVRKYWSHPGELIELFASGEVIAATSWDYVTRALLDEGHNVRQPELDKRMGWADALCIVRGTENRELAHKFINHILAPEAQARVAEINYTGVPNLNSKEFMNPDTWDALRMEDAPRLLQTIRFWDEVPRRARYLEVWNEIKAASVE